MLQINESILIPEGELEFSAMRAQGAGGQHVNKVSTAMQLRFDINASSLPDHIKSKLIHFADKRINREGIIIIKAQEHRSQARNRMAARERLRDIISKACYIRKKRIRTRITESVQRKRLDDKTRRGHLKRMRGKLKSYE